MLQEISRSFSIFALILNLDKIRDSIRAPGAALQELWEFAMWRGDLPAQRNPMELVVIKGATNQRKKPYSLNEDEFRKFLAHLEEPIRTLALLCVSFGLRISECLALKWSDVDWLNGTLQIVRGIVRQHVGPVKTTESERKMSADPELLATLKNWKHATKFAAESDWMFATRYNWGGCRSATLTYGSNSRRPHWRQAFGGLAHIPCVIRIAHGWTLPGRRLPFGRN